MNVYSLGAVEAGNRSITSWSGGLVDFALSGRQPASVRRIVFRIYAVGALLAALLVGPALHAQIPTTLTDKVFKGSGTIDLLKDVSSAELQQYLSGTGGLLLGIDVNEAADGNESSTSAGIAIKQLELVLTTSSGTFSFSDFFTSTTAMIQEAGTAGPQEFYTVFGKTGSSQITGGTDGFDLGMFDDVIRLQNVSFEGTILSAKLNVTFLKTAGTGSEGNESFFDFSNGFEDFALLGKQDAALLEAANFGVAEAPSGVSYAQSSPTITPQEAGLPSVPGAPAPPLLLLGAMGVVVALKSHLSRKSGNRE